MEAKIESKQEIELSHQSISNERKIEEILDTDGRGRYTHYFVKWQGLDKKYNSWVPLSQLSGYDDLLATFRAERLKAYNLKITKQRTKTQVDHELRTKSSIKKPSSKKLGPHCDDDSLLIGMQKIQFTDRKYHDDSDINSHDDMLKVQEPIPPLKSQQIKEKASLSSKQLINKTKIKKQHDPSPKRKTVSKPPSKENHPKIDADEFFDLRRFTDGQTYVTSADIRDKSALRILVKDIEGAFGIRVHSIIDKEIYFLLKWEHGHTDSFYARHYFSYQEIADKNAKLLLDYLRDYLNPRLI